LGLDEIKDKGCVMIREKPVPRGNTPKVKKEKILENYQEIELKSRLLLLLLYYLK